VDQKIEELLRDDAIVRVMKLVHMSSVSILELLEFGASLREINHALAAGVIVFDRTRVKASENYGIVAGGDYYFDFLNSKVKLSDLGLRLMEHIRERK
jgi:hypothetical protein